MVARELGLGCGCGGGWDRLGSFVCGCACIYCAIDKPSFYLWKPLPDTEIIAQVVPEIPRLTQNPGKSELTKAAICVSHSENEYRGTLDDLPILILPDRIVGWIAKKKFGRLDIVLVLTTERVLGEASTGLKTPTEELGEPRKKEIRDPP